MPDRPLDTINDALQNPEITAEFKKFLQSEFSDENLEFHERMSQFAKDANDPRISDDQLRTKAQELVDRYIVPDSPRQVNIASTQVTKIQSAMAGIGGASRQEIGSVLDGAHQEVVQMMGRDSFSRFQKTDGFQAGRELANDALDTAEKQLELLRARERQLKLNPGLGDKAKALVTSGGMVTLIRNVERQREALEKQIQERTQELPVDQKIYAAQLATPRQVAPPPQLAPPPVASPEVAPLDLEAGVVGRGRSNALDSVEFPKPDAAKVSVRDSMGAKDGTKVGQDKSLSVSDSTKDPSSLSVKDKVKLFEQGGGGAPPKRGVR